MRWGAAVIVGIGWTVAWQLGGRLGEGPAITAGLTIAYFAGLVAWMALVARPSIGLWRQCQTALGLATGVALTVGLVIGTDTGQDSATTHRVFGGVMFALLAAVVVMLLWSAVMAVQHTSRKIRDV